MVDKVINHLRSYDFLRSANIGFILSVSAFWGLKNDSYFIASPFMLGAFFAYIPDIEGRTKYPLLGRFFAIFWPILCLIMCKIANDNGYIVHYFCLLCLTFISSFLSVYGYRASLFSFLGLFGIVMSFIVEHSKLQNGLLISLMIFGGIVYSILSIIIRRLSKNSNIEQNLSKCISLTAEYYQTSHQLKWKNDGTNSKKLIQLQIDLNNTHEILRQVLFRYANKNFAAKRFRIQYLVFVEMVNFFEKSLAINSELEMHNLALNKANFPALFDLSKIISSNLYILADSILHHQSFKIDKKDAEKFEMAYEELNTIIETKATNNDNTEILSLRTMVDFEKQQFTNLEKLAVMINNNETKLNFKIDNPTLFITTQDYSFKTINENFNFKSTIFRHSLRLTFTVFVAILISHLFKSGQTNWIIMTSIMILRPNYSLTKTRATQRIIGTLIGGLFCLLLIFMTNNHLFYGILASIMIVIGLSFVQKNYQITSALVTISIILLYTLINDEPIATIFERIAYTSIGAIISLISMYILWPVWEKNAIFEDQLNAIVANKNYFNAMLQFLKNNNLIDTPYKLMRKEAFLENGNLQASFQRMLEEPVSKRKSIHNFYALLQLNQSFLSTVASFSSFFVGEKTLNFIPEIEGICHAINENMQNTIDYLKSKANIKSPNETTSFVETLKDNFETLNESRNMQNIAPEINWKPKEDEFVSKQLEKLLDLSEQTLIVSQQFKSF